VLLVVLGLRADIEQQRSSFDELVGELRVCVGQRHRRDATPTSAPHGSLRNITPNLRRITAPQRSASRVIKDA
jgi:hypothetical protein